MADPGGKNARSRKGNPPIVTLGAQHRQDAHRQLLRSVSRDLAEVMTDATVRPALEKLPAIVRNHLSRLGEMRPGGRPPVFDPHATGLVGDRLRDGGMSTDG